MKITILVPLFTAFATLFGLPVDLNASNASGSRNISLNAAIPLLGSPEFLGLNEPLFSQDPPFSDPLDIGSKERYGAPVIDPHTAKRRAREKMHLAQRNMPRQTSKPYVDQAHALTSKAIESTKRGDYEAAIRYYRSALKSRPDDEGIQISLGHVLYLRDKQKGDIRPNPKVAVLLDALQYGKTDWKASIRYLEDKFAVEKDKNRLMAIRDALITVKGIYDDMQSEQEMMEIALGWREIDTRLVLQDGFNRLDEGDYDGAVKGFQAALLMNPHDRSIRDMISYAEGQRYLQYERVSSWMEVQQEINGQLKAEARERKVEAQQALEQSQKALRLSRDVNDTEAVSISQRAIEIAREALAKAQAMMAWADARLEAVQKVSSVGLKGRRGVAGRVKGDVRIKTGQDWKPFNASASVNPGDELRTGSDGFAELMFTDGSTLDMDAKTTVKVGKPERKKSIYEEIKGRIRAEFHCAVKFGLPCSQVCYRTPTTVVCIRGTELEIAAPDDGPQTITVMDGFVEMIDRKRGKRIKIGRGKQVKITAEGQVKGPIPVEIRTLKRWWEEKAP